MKLSLAQNGYRNRDNEIVTCANAHRNRDNEIVTCANAHRNRENEIVTCANAHRNRENKIVTCANPHRNRDNEIVTCANPHRNRDNEIVTCANAHRNRDNEIVTCANAHRNRDNEIVTPKPVLRPSRWDFVLQGELFTSLAMKALQTNQRGGNTCDETLRTLYMTLFHTRCSHEQNDKTYLMGAIVPHCKPKSGKTDGKKEEHPSWVQLPFPETP